ncbi:hypothetical protein SLS62_005906 [Diatrype stigma]|uniref:C2H2-type domain-containing protein n=1 Tax=Diatrype stigma TaxID=117547 RepID=A0AAN9YRR5_9PEZI
MPSWSMISMPESIARTTNLQCPVCNEKFKDAWLKHAHQRAKAHFQCAVCKETFHDDGSVIRHVLMEHKTDHEIKCPGCDKVFSRAGQWMHHIEERECHRITPEYLEARQKKHADFAEALALLDTKTDYMATIDPSTKTDTWFNDPTVNALEGHDNLKPHQGISVDQDYKNPEDFPRLATQEYRLGDSKKPDLLTADAPVPKPLQPGNAWAQKKNLFPKSQDPRSAALAPTTEPAVSASLTASVYKQGHPLAPDRNAKIQIVNSSNAAPGKAGSAGGMSPAVSSSGGPITDPDHPNFDAGVFHDGILEKFKCPHRCNKKFRTAHSLIAHLKSPAHNREPVFCTTCLHKFSSKAALVQHMESSITRCGVRNSDGFRPTLAKLTGGILDTEPMSPLEDRGNPEEMVRDMGRIVVDPKAMAELQITPPKHVPGSEPKDDRKPAAGEEAIDWAQGRQSLTDRTAW